MHARILAPLLTLGLLLTACGDDSGDSDASTTAYSGTGESSMPSTTDLPTGTTADEPGTTTTTTEPGTTTTTTDPTTTTTTTDPSTGEQGPWQEFLAGRDEALRALSRHRAVVAHEVAHALLYGTFAAMLAWRWFPADALDAPRDQRRRRALAAGATFLVAACAQELAQSLSRGRGFSAERAQKAAEPIQIKDILFKVVQVQ